MHSRYLSLAACALLALAVQARVQATELAGFNEGPRSRNCGTLMVSDDCLQIADSVTARPVVTGEFEVGRLMPEHSSNTSDNVGSGQGSGQAFDQGDFQGSSSGHDVGHWLSHGRNTHYEDRWHHGGNGWDGWDSSQHGSSGDPSTPVCDPVPVPLPNGTWLLASGLFGLVILRRRRAIATQM